MGKEGESRQTMSGRLASYIEKGRFITRARGAGTEAHLGRPFLPFSTFAPRCTIRGLSWPSVSPSHVPSAGSTRIRACRCGDRGRAKRVIGKRLRGFFFFFVGFVPPGLCPDLRAAPPSRLCLSGGDGGRVHQILATDYFLSIYYSSLF